MVKVGDSILIYDIECRVFGKPDAEKDEFRLFGCYSYKYNKYWLLTDKRKIQEAINRHHFLVGFNNVGTRDRGGYDNKILERNGISFKYKKIIDLRTIFLQRASQMKIKKGLLGDLLMRYSLDYITKTIDIVDEETGKQEIDYNVFMKPAWTKDELKQISEYARRDIEITKKLYEWIEDYFESFKDFVRPFDVEKKYYLTVSTAKFTYKAICKAMSWQEKYGTSVTKDSIIGGGYIGYPAGERFEGDIYALDFASLYPHIMMMCNIYGRKKTSELDERPVWSGGGKWRTEGTYYADDMGKVGKLIRKWYSDRVKYKDAGDKREYSIKIILNTMYGILDNPYYVNVFDKVGSGDVTRIGRQWIQYARKIFREAGYKNIYTDTDSSYILDHKKDKNEILKLCKKIEEDIKATVPFPQDTFKFKIDDEINYMFFFKGGDAEKPYPENEFFEDDDDFINKPLGLMKKNYIYVTSKDKVKMKNLGLRKKDRSALSKKIFWDDLVPQIIKGQVKFGKSYLKDMINTLLREDMELALMRKDVGNIDQYKNTTSIQAQISLKYGPGIHFFIPNTRGIGVGKGKSFCTLEEFKKHNLKHTDIDTTTFWNELEYFVKPVIVKNIFDYAKT